jgi:photosystem II stability/assembly factor-like uncharacterized protein
MKTKKIVFGMAIFAFLLALVNYQQIKKNHDLSSLQISDQEMRDEIESESEIEMEESPKNPLGLAHERFMQRAGKDGKIPSNALVKAKNHITNMPPTDDAGLWNWSWIGPGNIGGRIRAILIHPVTKDIWIGSVSGGIWKSSNNGATWSPVNDFMANLAITCIVVDPINTSIMYASTGEGFGNSDQLPGAGIFKSTDGGINWNQLASTANDDFTYVSRLSHHPDSSGVLYAATAGVKGIWKTKDGGNTWIKKLTPGSNGNDVKVHPNTPAYVIAGCRFDAYISGDYGSTWNKINTGNPNQLPADVGRCEVSFCPSNNLRVFISVDNNKGEIWRSADRGQTWSLRSSGVEYLGKQGNYDNTIWIDPQSSDRLVVGGIDLYKSNDGGATLVKISRWQNYHNGGVANSAHADQHIIVSHPDYNANDFPVVYFGNDGGIQMTNDIWSVAEESGWINLCNSTLGITQFFGGAALPDASVIVGGTQDNDKLRYRSSGAWSGTGQWYQAQYGDGGYAAVNYNNPDIIYGEYTNLSIKKSNNGGDSYNSAINGLTDADEDTTALFIAPFVIDPVNPSRLIAGGARIWRTTDDADNWSKIKENIGGRMAGGHFFFWRCSAIDIAPSNTNTIWVGYENGVVAKTTNDGGNWVQVDGLGATPLPNRFVTDIAINPGNPDEVIVTFSQYQPDNVWRTTDGGNNWQQITGTPPFDLPALQVNSVRFHPANNNWIYIGTDLGIFATENGGQKWSVNPRYQNNEGPVNVEVDELFWAGDELIAATHGRGMFKCRPLVNIYVNINSPDGGDGTWAKPYNTVQAAINAAGNGTNIYIFQGTYNETPLLFSKRGYILQYNGNVIIE